MFRSPFLPGVELETALSNSAEARMTLNSSKEMNEENRTMWVGSVVYDRGLDVVRHFVKIQRVGRYVTRVGLSASREESRELNWVRHSGSQVLRLGIQRLLFDRDGVETTCTEYDSP